MKRFEILFAALLPATFFAACTEGSGATVNSQKTGGSSGDGDVAGDGDSGGSPADGGAPSGGASSGDGDSGGGGDSGSTMGDGDAGGATGSGGTNSDSGGTSGDGDGDGAGSGGAGSGGGMLPPDVTTPKIMIVGDSISAGPGCYKKYLKELLDADSHSYTFVGKYNDDCGGGVMHSAVSCTTSSQYTQASFTVPNCFTGEFSGMAPLMAEHQPDVVLLQLGVNDVWGGTAPIAPILANYTTLVEQARAQNPNVFIFVAQIHKIITDNCQNAASTMKAQELIEAVPAWAAGISTPASPVVPADLWTNSDPMEADDCVHPNDAGARRMADNWFAALKDIIP